MSLTDWKIRDNWNERHAKRAEALGAVLSTFLDRNGQRVFMARIPGVPKVIWASDHEQGPAQRAVLDLAHAEMGKRRTAAHVTYFAKLEGNL